MTKHGMEIILFEEYVAVLMDEALAFRTDFKRWCIFHCRKLELASVLYDMELIEKMEAFVDSRNNERLNEYRKLNATDPEYTEWVNNYIESLWN